MSNDMGPLIIQSILLLAFLQVIGIGVMMAMLSILNRMDEQR